MLRNIVSLFHLITKAIEPRVQAHIHSPCILILQVVCGGTLGKDHPDLLKPQCWHSWMFFHCLEACRMPAHKSIALTCFSSSNKRAYDRALKPYSELALPA